MALFNPSELPENWDAFEARCRERIAKIRSSGDQGHFAGIYAEDVEILLKVMHESHMDYDNTPRNTYPRVRRGEKCGCGKCT